MTDAFRAAITAEKIARISSPCQALTQRLNLLVTLILVSPNRPNPIISTRQLGRISHQRKAWKREEDCNSTTPTLIKATLTESPKDIQTLWHQQPLTNSNRKKVKMTKRTNELSKTNKPHRNHPTTRSNWELADETRHDFVSLVNCLFFKSKKELYIWSSISPFLGTYPSRISHRPGSAWTAVCIFSLFFVTASERISLVKLK